MSERERYIVAGGSGLIGAALAASLAADGHDVVVLSRAPEEVGHLAAGVRAVGWDGRSLGSWAREVDGAAAVVNLAGENLASGRWTAARKRRLRSSRVEPTRALVEAIGRARVRPLALLQASGISYYGACGDEPVDEESPPGRGFLPELGREWEAASAPASELGVRRVVMRSGAVLAREGGALAKMLPPFRLGVGGPVGGGRQGFSWIHRLDEIGAIRFLAARSELSGACNLTAPAPVSNAELARALGCALGRPAFLPVPGPVLRLVFGEMGSVLLEGQRAVPRRLLAAGFAFRFPTLEGALADLVGRRR